MTITKTSRQSLGSVSEHIITTNSHFQKRNHGDLFFFVINTSLYIIAELLELPSFNQGQRADPALHREKARGTLNKAESQHEVEINKVGNVSRGQLDVNASMRG